MTNQTRRTVLKWLSTGAAWLGLARPVVSREPTENATAAESPTPTENAITVSWSDIHDRVFLSGDCWANPMEDWAVVDGAAECLSIGKVRNVQLVTHQLTNPNASFEMSAVISQVEVKGRDTGAGFQIGIHSELGDVRSNCFAHNGIPAGMVDGKLVLGPKTIAVDGLAKPDHVTLKLSGQPNDGRVDLTLVAIGKNGDQLGRVSLQVSRDDVVGNVALMNHFGKGKTSGKAKGEPSVGARYRFNDWSASGAAFTINKEFRFGPILWSMYSLSDSRGDDGFVMKMSVLTGPLGENDNKDVELFVQKDDEWKSLGTAPLDTDAWTATFRIPNWDEKTETRFKAVYQQSHPSGKTSESTWSGIIQANPVGRPLRIAALTCQKDYGFPYAPVAENIVKLKPDLVYFSGDQLYENHGGYGFIRSPADRAILNYLRKYYMHGWSFREAMRNAPTVCLPDDHDVFQGNIWGEGGKPMATMVRDASSLGGYVEPARMVNAVHKTTVGHHPDAYDATPVLQGISVYYGDLVYGDVSFAIIADRQFKNGPEHVDTGSGRADHVADPDFDTSSLDKPGLVMLGDRQESFLKNWVDDWRGHKMKVLLSQTVFAGVATHHGSYDGYLKADLDSGAWPQTARDNAIKIVREGMPLHINGDQHLTSLVQYGVDEQRDSCWSFCTPAIAAGYPRWWRPDDMNMPHENRPAHGLPQTGEYTDGCGNLVYVYAVGYPEVESKKNRYEVAHQKGSGFGFVTIDTEAKTYLCEAFRFQVNATDGKADNQFDGFPVTIHQEENNGKNRLQ